MEYAVDEIHLYQNFDPIFYEHDLALVKTTVDIELSENVQIINLPNVSAPAGELVVLTGWRSDVSLRYLPILYSTKCSIILD